MKSITLTTAIEEALSLSRDGFSSSYFGVEDSTGKNVKIRVSSHQGKASNNEDKTISFITDKKIKGGFGYDRIVGEYLMAEDNYTDTYQTIEEVLEWEDIDSQTKDYVQKR